MIALYVLVAAMLMMAVERCVAGRRWPHVRGWFMRALLLNTVQAAMVFIAGATWDPWLRIHRLWSVDGLGTIGGALVGYLVITFVYYWWHRWRHRVELLWRWLHQIHHSPQRIEIITSFYKHPFELVANGLVSSMTLSALVGCGPEAASLAVLLTGLAELFYHWNVPTPHWWGYVVQRPEMHCVHHQEDAHRYNFSDLPIWDLCFGTFRNPPLFAARCGFGEEERRIGEMLIGRVVDSPSPAVVDG